MHINRFFFLSNEVGDGSGAGSGTGGAPAASTAGAASSTATTANPGAATTAVDTTAAATTAQTTGGATSFLKDDFSFEEGWQNKLPDDKFGDLKSTLANYRDLPTLGKALKDNMAAARTRTEGLVKLPTPPAADAKPEAVEAYKAEMAAYRKAVGVPDSPEGYGIKAPEKLPEGVQWNEGQAKEFASLAHKLGLTPDQLKGIHEWEIGRTATGHQQYLAGAKQHDEAQDKIIRDTFGTQLDKRMVDASRVGLTFFGNDKGPQTRAELMIGLAKIADAISEDKLASGAQVTNKLGPEAMAQDIVRDPASPYNNPSHPRHAEQAAYVVELMKKAYPG